MATLASYLYLLVHSLRQEDHHDTDDASAGEIYRFSCPNPQCPRFNRPGEGNIVHWSWTGLHKHIERLRCTACDREFSEREGTLMARSKVSWRISRYALAVHRKTFRPVLLRLRPIQVRSLSGRALARATLGREFPISALSIAERVPSPTIAHVSSRPPYNSVRWVFPSTASSSGTTQFGLEPSAISLRA